MTIDTAGIRANRRADGQRGNHLVQVFWNVDMRCQHPALSEICKKYSRIRITDLLPGELIVFVNAKRDRMKILAGTTESKGWGVLAYYRSPRGCIDVQALQYVAKAFSSQGEVHYDDALKSSLLERLDRRKRVRKAISVPAK